MVVIQHTVKDESGNKLATIEVTSAADLKKIAKILADQYPDANNPQVKQTLKKSSSKSTYTKLIDIRASKDGKNLIFNFEEGPVILSFITRQVTHADGRQLLPTHYERITAGIPYDIAALASVPDDKNSEWVAQLLKVVRSSLISRTRYTKLGSIIERISTWDALGMYEKLAKAGVALDRTNSYSLNREGRTPAEILRVDQWYFERMIKDSRLYDYVRNYQQWLDIANERDDNRSLILFRQLYEERNSLPDMHMFGYINILVTEHGYPTKRLLDYIYKDLPDQGISIGNGYNSDVNMFVDYVRMCREMEMTNFDRYPKYMKTYHDVATQNYRKYREHISNKAFAEKAADRLKSLEFSKRGFDYVVVAPSTAKDIIDEGNAQRHCVASYIDRVIMGETNIMFMRTKEHPEVPLITMEVSTEGKIRQAKGECNRAPVDEETAFITMYQLYLDKKREGKAIELDDGIQAAPAEERVLEAV